jgi:Rrf2 family protein
MKFIARDTDYAIRSLVFMERSSRKKGKHVITVDEIVRELHLPGRFARRILQRLAKKKFLSSYKGKDGGFSFLRSPKKIRLKDVIEVFQGKIDLTNCMLKKRTCPDIKTCTLRKRLKKIDLLITKELDKITIASLLL